MSEESRKATGLAEQYIVGPNFHGDFKAFRQRCNQKEKERCVFEKNAEDIGFSWPKTMISIGAGDGEEDSVILSLMPKIERYYAVEPNKESGEQCVKVLMEKFPKLKVKWFDSTFQNFMSPPEKVDIITMLHCTFHFNEDFVGLFKKALDWLNDDGFLMIVSISKFRDGHGGKNWVAQIGEDFKIPERMYWYEDEMRDLKDSGFTIYRQWPVRNTSLDGRNMDDAWLRFLKLQDLDKDGLDDMMKWALERFPSPDDQYQHKTHYITVFKKKDYM